MISIDPSLACDLILRLRQFQVKEGVVEADPGSNLTDENARQILADHDSDPVEQEMRQFLEGLNVEELASLMALMWIGRGDYAKEDWNEALEEAKRIEDARAPDYLIGTPLAADYIEQALSEYGYSCEDTNRNHL